MESKLTPISKPNKIAYIDNLRVVLTVLVILHHTVITYGGPGGWYFREKTTLAPALIGMTLFVSTNQAFFMGFFFFLSSLFLEPSLVKKGRKQFLIDRFKRLGIPLVFYSLILSPILNYLVEHYGRGEHFSFMEYMSGYHHWIDFGVLWFVAALLLFSILAGILLRADPSPKKFSFPRNSTIFFSAIVLGLISYLVRGYFPVGWTLRPLGFQLGHFTQYIFLFALGIVAYRNQWLEEINYEKGIQWMRFALLMVIVVFPLLYVVKEVTHSSGDSFSGSFTWQSLIAAEWEQITGLSIIVALLGIARKKWNAQSAFQSSLSRAAFATYIFHPLVLIGLSLMMINIQIEPALKLLVVGPLAVVGSFSLAALLCRISLVNQII